MSEMVKYTTANSAIAKLKEAMRTVGNESKWLSALEYMRYLGKLFNDQEDIRVQILKITDLVEAAIADLGLSKRANSQAGYATKSGSNISGYSQIPSSTMAFVTMLGTPVETLRKKVDTWYSSTIPTSDSGEQEC